MFASSLMTKQTELKRERKRSDRLLCQMLPKAVAKQLKQRRQVGAWAVANGRSVLIDFVRC
jgi:hypothetical protein